MTDNQEVKTWPRASLEQVVMDEMNSIDDQRVKHFKLIFKYQETLALQNKEEESYYECDDQEIEV